MEILNIILLLLCLYGLSIPQSCQCQFGYFFHKTPILLQKLRIFVLNIVNASGNTIHITNLISVYYAALI